MSAICGIFSMDGMPIPVEMELAMMDDLRIYPADVSETYHDGCVFLGCHAKHITHESKAEKLPFLDETSGLVITADAIIDNRTELFHLLDIHPRDWSDMPDSRLILAAYIKWGNECPVYMAGDFAFAIWDGKKRELFCARDHVGKRTFYYSSSEIFAFSTLIKPLFAAGNEKELNDMWVADFLSLEGVAHEFECDQTIYKYVRQLPPAHTLRISCRGMEIKQYWYPQEIPRLKLKSDREYEEAFRDVFFEAVRCRLRCTGAVGVMLSGGLDSGAVASIAASQLRKDGKRLKAFSAVPMSGYKDWLPGKYAADERPYIEAVREHAGNIDVTYCASEGKHSMTDTCRFLELLEQPYKIVENLFWVDELAATAAKNGCSVLLDGQFGNCTISFGNFLVHIVSLYKHMKWWSLIKEIKGYSELHGLKPLQTGKSLMRQLLPDSLLTLLHKSNNVEDNNKEGLLPVNPELALRWKTQDRLQKAGFKSNPAVNCDLSEVRRLILQPAAFSHLGAIETKLSLAHGLAKRDPTRDKRVVEFCMSLPGEQYVREGQERWLIRRAMEGILPDEVRLNTSIRGKQSADWIQRLLPVWGEIKCELEQMLVKEEIKPYIDVTKLKSMLTSLGDTPEYRTWGLELRTLLLSLIFNNFLMEI